MSREHVSAIEDILAAVIRMDILDPVGNAVSFGL